jgi:hypothetical protein
VAGTGIGAASTEPITGVGTAGGMVEVAVSDCGVCADEHPARARAAHSANAKVGYRMKCS